MVTKRTRKTYRKIEKIGRTCVEHVERKEIGWNGSKGTGQGLEWFLSTFTTSVNFTAYVVGCH